MVMNNLIYKFITTESEEDLQAVLDQSNTWVGAQGKQFVIDCIKEALAIIKELNSIGQL
jgi:arginine/lysine/ornithine decarboxylase